MSKLKTFFKKDLSGKELENFKIDKQIVIYRRKYGILKDNKDFITKLGITSNQFAGRLVSLGKRGYIEVKKINLKTKTTSYNITNKETKNEIMVDIYNKMPHKKIVEKYDVSISTVSRIKKFMIDIGFKPKSIPKPSNTYSNVNGVNKEIARNKMAKYIVDSDVIGVIPTLSHIACTIEKKILVDQPTQKFIGVEMDKVTYKEMKATIKRENLPFETHCGKISDKIYGQVEDVYAHLILDYCGCLPTFSKEIEYAINNKIVKSGGVIAITFGKPHRGDNAMTRFILSLGATITNNPNDTRCISDKATEAYFNRIIGDNFDFLEVFNYTDIKENGKGYPMTLIILKRK